MALRRPWPVPLRRLLAIALVAAVLAQGAASGAPPDASAGAVPADEAQVRAAFLYNLARFVEWPSSAFATASTPLVACVIGADDFGAVLEAITRGRTVAGRNVVVRRGVDPDKQIGCHVLYIPRGEQLHEQEVLAQARGATILTVAESGTFARDGGVVSLVVDRRRVRFEVNIAAAYRARLTISSRLLTLASAVYGGDAAASARARPASR